MIRHDLTDFREWARLIASGELTPTGRDVSRIVTELLDEIDLIHNRYAHEGGSPQILTVEVLIEWVRAIGLPQMDTVNISLIPNVFTADFAASLEQADIAQLQALGLTVVDTGGYNSYRNGRYMLKWNPPPDDECP